ncbi:MAG: GTPase HflX [Salaquimonas sp.]|nr:GTPase HflX [Salaquimonas sp.]
MSEYERGSKSRFQWQAEENARPERALIVVPEFKARIGAGVRGRAEHDNSPDISTPRNSRTSTARLAEAEGLARAISLEIAGSGVVTLKTIQPGTLFGKGKIDEIAGMVKAEEVGLVVVDHALTPVQQHNLEKAWNAKVLDRTGLILEIFGERARTKEGRLQVELAHLNYLKGRLVRQWTHLERQRGGLGKTGGPGETQIEADRRLLQERILRLEKELEKVRRTRSLHRAKRKKVPTPVVALVGYTNAGKSTLFNRLTGADVMAKDLLFATLDPTLRRLTLPQGREVILSDTVGFVSNLPTMLVAAFRATLEEVIEADLILHVRDIADSESAAQSADVYEVLDQIGIEAGGHARVIEVWNKIDLLAPEALQALRSREATGEAPVLVSAATGEGTDKLLARIEQMIGSDDNVFDIHLGIAELGELPWIYEHGHVVERHDGEDGSVDMRVRVTPGERDAFRRLARENTDS